MTFGDEDRRAPAEPFVPMINVVFLLLIFFLMTSRLAPPDPFEVAPPLAETADDGRVAPILYVSAKGEIGFEDLRGPAAIAALAARLQGSDEIARLRADARTRTSDIARLMKDLAAAGLPRVDLVVTR